MAATTKGTTLFDLCGGHPALDLVNSLDNRFRSDGPREILTSYAELLRFLEESGLLSRQRARLLERRTKPKAAVQILQSVTALREATAAVLYRFIHGDSPPAKDTEVLEEYFKESLRHRELRWLPETNRHPPQHQALTWSWGRFEMQPDLPIWILSQAVSDLLLSGHLGRVHACDMDSCRWLFLDTSKNGTRRWCNMKICGNRMKARRFQTQITNGRRSNVHND